MLAHRPLLSPGSWPPGGKEAQPEKGPLRGRTRQGQGEGRRAFMVSYGPFPTQPLTADPSVKREVEMGSRGTTPFLSP